MCYFPLLILLVFFHVIEHSSGTTICRVLWVFLIDPGGGTTMCQVLWVLLIDPGGGLRTPSQKVAEVGFPRTTLTQ